MNELKYLFMWDWSKIPESEHSILIAHVEARRWPEVAKLCEQYGVSAFCCCNAEGLQNWAHWAIENGIINANNGTGLATDAGRDSGTVIE